MVEYAIKQVHNISRPGHEATTGDTVEIECVGGYVPQVDPLTMTATTEHQRFVIRADGGLSKLRELAFVPASRVERQYCGHCGGRVVNRKAGLIECRRCGRRKPQS